MKFPLIDLRCRKCLGQPHKPSVPVRRVDLENYPGARRCVGCGAKLNVDMLLKSGPERDWITNSKGREERNLGPGDAARIKEGA